MPSAGSYQLSECAICVGTTSPRLCRGNLAVSHVSNRRQKQPQMNFKSMKRLHAVTAALVRRRRSLPDLQPAICDLKTHLCLQGNGVSPSSDITALAHSYLLSLQSPSAAAALSAWAVTHLFVIQSPPAKKFTLPDFQRAVSDCM